jgi:branched-subunit amino acid aminotransferase/4-amino-4-deoxychorismate lyase
MSARRPFPEGSGIFETLRTQDGKVAELSRHMRRAVSACESLSIPMPGEEVLRSEIIAAMTLEPFQLGRLRICISHAGFVVTHDSYEELTEEARLTFHSTSSQVSGEQLKRYPYDDHYMILDEARDWGFDDAIIFSKTNEVTETALSNIAFLIGGQWCTPQIGAGILPGTMRAIAIERLGVSVRPIHISEIADVDGALLLSSLKIAQPVSHIGDHRLPIVASSRELASKMRASIQYFSVV